MIQDLVLAGMEAPKSLAAGLDHVCERHASKNRCFNVKFHAALQSR